MLLVMDFDKMDSSSSLEWRETDKQIKKLTKRSLFRNNDVVQEQALNGISPLFVDFVVAADDSQFYALTPKATAAATTTKFLT